MVSDRREEAGPDQCGGWPFERRSFEEFEALEELAEDKVLDDAGKAKLASLQLLVDGTFSNAHFPCRCVGQFRT